MGMDSSHHAYVYFGTSVTSALPPVLHLQSSDVVHFIQPSWGIDDSRRVSQAAYMKPTTAAYRELVICAQQLTYQAQNALLKLFEEPPETTRLHLVVPDIGVLLPTLRSRVTVVASALREQSSASSTWSEFMHATSADRLARIAEFVKQKDTASQAELLEAAIAEPTLPAHIRLLIDTYARSAGASRKLLLEEVALSLPFGGRPV